MIKSRLMKRYEQFSHTADIGMHVYGNNLEELFENAALAMFDIIADLEGLKSPLTQEIKLSAPSHEELLVKWLDELLYNFYTKSIIYSEFKIEELSQSGLRATVRGRAASINRNRLKTEIKAVTYSGLEIEKTAEGCKVDIIFDV